MCKMKKIFFVCIGLITFTLAFSTEKALSQEKVIIDQVVAVVGNSAVLESDLINQVRQMEAQGMSLGTNPYCTVLDEVLYQKLLFNQALIDSLEVSDEHVEQVLERRIRYFIQQIGSREKLEAYYGKSVDELKDEFREMVYEQELSQQMERKITANVNITPAEVRHFFNNLSEDSIPMVESELVLAKIVKSPPVQDEEIGLVRSRLEEFRERVLQGERFATLAIMYSEDPGSARNGGELGFYGRGELFPEFEAVAFSLRPGEVSEIVETQAGYHIIQMIERRGEQINVRHILLRPKISPVDMVKARNELDSIRTMIQNEEISFSEAALKHSDHPGRISEGLMVNPYTGTNRFRVDEIEPSLFFEIDKLEVGDVSPPIPTMTDDGQQAFMIVYLKSRRDAHRANLQEDYDYIQQIALRQKEYKAIGRWINRRLEHSYVFVHEKYHDCSFDFNWIK
jgi:peptidyl-prolyl cis-trans isomerase SurA